MTRKPFTRMMLSVGLHKALGVTIVMAGAVVWGLSTNQADASLLNAEWKFDEASGSSASDSVGGFTGTLNGAATFASGGKIGNDVSLNGSTSPTNTNVTVTDNVALRPANKIITVSAWVNPTSNGAFRGIWDKINAGAGLALDDNNGFPRLIHGGASLVSSTSISINNWHLIVGVVNANAATSIAEIYVDGVLTASTVRGANNVFYLPNTTNLAIGGDNASTFLFQGKIDDTAVWNDELTGGEAAALYNVANNATLNYDAGQSDQLFSAFRSGPTGHTTIGSRPWHYTTGLSGTLGAVAQTGSDFSIKLDAAGDGLITPEPASIALLAVGGMLVMGRRRIV